MSSRNALSFQVLDAACVRAARTPPSSEVLRILAGVIHARRFPAAVGDLVSLESRAGGAVLAQVLGFDERSLLLSSFEPDAEVLPGARVVHAGRAVSLHCSEQLFGSVLDALGEPLARAHSATTSETRSEHSSGGVAMRSYDRAGKKAPPPLSRAPIRVPFATGIRAVDAFVTLGRGQRIAVLAEPGVGKSTLMGMLARHSDADVQVIAMIGERGREVREFLEDTLPAESRRKTIVVVSTSDEPALRRVAAADTAMRIAEHFRAEGRHVCFQMDSLTRYLRALRELGLAAGEPSVRRGFPASVFGELPRFIERAGSSERGSITALYTMLTTSELEQDPTIDEVKSLTDGHLILSRTLAERGQYPAVDILRSLSRLQNRLLPKNMLVEIRAIRALMARLDGERDMLLFGAEPGPELARALSLEPLLCEFLSQGEYEASSMNETLLKLDGLVHTEGTTRGGT